jgi:anti-sigma factor RsiW
MLEEHVFDLLPGYALGSLDEEDLLKVARHLPRCAACRAELEGYSRAVDGLAQVVPLREPPADLRARVVAGVDRAARSSQAAARQQAPRIEAVRGQADLHMPARQAQDGRSGFLTEVSRWLARPAGMGMGGLALLLVVVLLSRQGAVLGQLVKRCWEEICKGEGARAGSRRRNGGFYATGVPPLPPGGSMSFKKTSTSCGSKWVPERDRR